MISFTHKQFDDLDFIYFKQRTIAFVHEELRLFGYEIESADIQSGFEQLYRFVEMNNHCNRIAVVLLLFASFAFHEVFTQQSVTGFMDAPMAPDKRQKLVQDALQRYGYDSEFLLRETWI